MWIALALAAALCQVLRNTAMKRLGHALDEYINVWGRFTFLLPFALIGCVLGGWPRLEPGFAGWCLLFGACQTISTLALSKALKLSAISLVTALWKISLLILLGMAYVSIGEAPSALGVAGVLLSAAGVYLLNVSRARISPWAPLATLVTDRGQRWTMLAAVFYAPSVIAIKQVLRDLRKRGNSDRLPTPVGEALGQPGRPSASRPLTNSQLCGAERGGLRLASATRRR